MSVKNSMTLKKAKTTQYVSHCVSSSLSSESMALHLETRKGADHRARHPELPMHTARAHVLNTHGRTAQPSPAHTYEA